MGILDIIAIVIGIIILLSFALYVFLKYAPKGYVGETIVRKTMDFTLPKDVYKIFNNVMLYDGEKSIQIDHIIASVYGIFVVETKNYSGSIYGNENSKSFTQYVGRQRNVFYSPIKQNKGHIYALNKVVGRYPYTSVVVFLGEAKLKVRSTTFVGTPLNASHYIRSFNDVKLTDEQLNDFITKLENSNVSDFISNRDHVANVNYNLEKYETALDTMTCPWCGSKLVQRKGKYGEFYGCSAYPKCKYIHKDKQ
ncbi:MAG: NERD domain-containing protein [Clostridia bacterium]|nr:NERD domain-containing protein [Clostridia bacterium]MBR2499130.1 NERD domain-containing protein [Clostridia bacterium]